MRVNRIRIKNILGIEELDLAPGQVTVVRGRNGSGKTSVLKAVKAALGGGTDVTLLRDGATQGEIMLELDDGRIVTRRITPKGSRVQVTGGESVARKPQTLLDALFDAVSFNPVEFLQAGDKRQLELLLQALPLELPAADLTAAVGNACAADALELGGHAFDVCERARKNIYDDRTGLNRAAKEKAATVSQLRTSMPTTDESETDWLAVIAKHDENLQALKDEGNTTAATLKETRDTRIRALELERDERIAELQTTVQAATRVLRVTYDDDLAGLHAEFKPQITEADRALTVAREKADAIAKARGVVETVQRFEIEVATLEADSATCSERLKNLEVLRSRLLEQSPVPGLNVVDGVILYEGHPFAHVSTSEQVRVALAVAGLRAGELPLVLLDRAESLDADTLAEFERQCVDAGLQVLLTQVDDGDFRVEVDAPAQVTPSGATENASDLF